MFKTATFCAISVAMGISGLHAQDSTRVSFDSGFGGNPAVFNEDTSASIALSGGTAADGNGFVLQLGYYDGATTGNNFLGNFVVLAGQGSANTATVPGATITYNQISIGDLNGNGAGNGTFALTLDFVVGSATSGNNLPAAGRPLSIRFFNGTSFGSASFFNAVSNDSWLWVAPATPQSVVAISLDDPGLEFLSIFLGQGAQSAFHTTVPIPEPSTYALVIVGVLGATVARLRLKTTA